MVESGSLYGRRRSTYGRTDTIGDEERSQSLQQNMCEFSKYPANPIALGDFSKNCANGSECLLFPNSRWIWSWSYDRIGAWTATLEKDMKIYSFVK
jgi:hypothetical protein